MMEPAERPTGPVKPGPPEGGRDTDTMLVVDDSPVDRHLAGALVEKIAGWKAAYAGNGSEALAAIESGPPAAVLTDLMMPGMSGLQLVEAIRERYPLVPVIVMTAHGSEDVAIQALQRGAASYVAKRSLARDLAGTLRQIRSAMRSDREHRRVLGHLTCLRSQFALENDPSIVPALVAYIQQDLVHLGHCDENEAMRLGIALGEALLNALYHGNLEISSALREEDDSAYYQLGEERRQMPPFRERRIHVDAECRRQESVFAVRDEGRGFDPSTLPDPASRSSIAMASGRGILLIRTFMDDVTFSQGGTQITMIKRHKATPRRGTPDAALKPTPSSQPS
jgi:CheY-like chemotaxis protein